MSQKVHERFRESYEESDDASESVDFVIVTSLAECSLGHIFILKIYLKNIFQEDDRMS